MSEENSGKVEWSEKHWKEMLVKQRVFLWLDDTLDKLADWIGLEPGMTAIDAGCGLGYLGYTFWKYIGKNGRYFGVDMSSQLLQDARAGAAEWAKGGETHFMTGDVYRLPFPDNFADIVMCQTLLMHLKEPREALAEMLRMARPGAPIVCNEPDNLSSMLMNDYSSMPEPEIEEKLLFSKVAIICNEGRIKLGRGDLRIGARVPLLMSKLGMTDIETRLNDRVYFAQPPYDSPAQQYHLKEVREQLEKENTPEGEEKREFFRSRLREEFQAGGGDPKDFERFEAITDKRIAEHTPMKLQQIENNEYYFCHGVMFYIIRGRKPL